MTLKVVNSPFTEGQIKLLNELLPNLSQVQKIWLNGYLAGSFSKDDVIIEEQGVEAGQPAAATILYASQTGNAKELALEFVEKFIQNNIDVEAISMNEFPVEKLGEIKNLFIIASTQGEGDVPDNATSFYDFLHSSRAPQLTEINYSVLALGDTSYEFYCKVGKDFDEQLKKLGAKSIIPRIDCDLDYQDDAEKWFSSIQQELMKQNVHSTSIAKKVNKTSREKSIFNKKNPFYAEVLEKINLNKKGSNKETYHLKLSIEGSGIEFEPGDSIGIFPTNSQELVDAILKELNFDENQKVTLDGKKVTIGHALKHELEITVLTKPLFEKLGETEIPARDWREGRDLLDAIIEYEFSIDAQQLADSLRKLPYRLYSIASSHMVTCNEVHLTIGLVNYQIENRQYKGVASGQVAYELEVGDKLPIFIQENDHFRLPDENQHIIMIGAGTGIAPFRSFIQQRNELKATGQSWLFFGDQHRDTDFLYEVEWQNYIKENALTKMTVAFSRDQAEKIYVQNRIEENGEEFFRWLEEGATIFICGDEKHMAKDVEKAIINVIAQHNNHSAEEAQKYFNELVQQKRYLRDVY